VLLKALVLLQGKSQHLIKKIIATDKSDFLSLNSYPLQLLIFSLWTENSHVSASMGLFASLSKNVCSFGFASREKVLFLLHDASICPAPK